MSAKPTTRVAATRQKDSRHAAAKPVKGSPGAHTAGSGSARPVVVKEATKTGPAVKRQKGSRPVAIKTVTATPGSPRAKRGAQASTPAKGVAKRVAKDPSAATRHKTPRPDAGKPVKAVSGAPLTRRGSQASVQVKGAVKTATTIPSAATRQKDSLQKAPRIAQPWEGGRDLDVSNRSSHLFVIKTSDFLVSVADPTKLPEPPLPEIVFAGRSNVGKSSLINMLLGRRALAKVSAAPGKTRLVNYFLVNESVYFVDLPGYGYAKTSQDLRREWGNLIESYLLTGRTRIVVQLLDIRHTPTRQDLDSLAWFCHNMVPVVVVLTKGDKLGRSAQTQALTAMKTRLKSLPVLQILTSSSRSKSGRDDLLGFLGAWIKKGHVT